MPPDGAIIFSDLIGKLGRGAQICRDAVKLSHVRFAPESGHVQRTGEWAKSGHSLIHSIAMSARASS